MHSHAFDLSRIRKIAVKPPQVSIRQEAGEILCSHPEIQEKLRIKLQKCKNEKREDITPLIKQINAMINNRYLFQRFLHQSPFAFGHDRQFFDKAFFSRWEAVKNGLYKASIIRDNESVVNEVCSLFMNLIREETNMAKEMIIMEPDSG